MRNVGESAFRHFSSFLRMVQLLFIYVPFFGTVWPNQMTQGRRKSRGSAEARMLSLIVDGS